MPRLRLILGPPGSGKTRAVLQAAAEAALAHPLSPPGPPLRILVPEQQAAQTERALLERPAELDGGGASALSSVQVITFSWLAQQLEDAAGIRLRPLGDRGRRLLVWRLLGEPIGDGSVFGLMDDRRRRSAAAAVAADLLAELGTRATTPEQLAARSEQLPAESRLRAKLSALAELLSRYQAACAARGLAFAHPATRAAGLLTPQWFSGLSDLRIWVDGFRDFTPAEEQALAALLEHSAELTATLLLDPARLEGPADGDAYDWYAPTRRQLHRWRALARRVGAEVEETHLPARPERAQVLAVETSAQLNERAEVDAAARRIRTLILPADRGGLGLRFGQISVVTRRLEPYAGLIRQRFADHGIPCFIDARQSLAHHPLVRLLSGGLRLALGEASRADVAALLKCGLLDDAEQASLRLELRSRQLRRRPSDWLAQSPWTLRQRPGSSKHATERAADEAELAELDLQRRVILAPIVELQQASHDAASGVPTVRRVLGEAWLRLLTPAAQARIAQWQAEAEAAGDSEQATEHRLSLPRAAELWDELARLAGDTPVAVPPGLPGLMPGELCSWVDRALSELDYGFPPPTLDSVLVTDIERGRHPQVAASLLLGLAEDCWPLPSAESPLLSDAERSTVNLHAEPLLGGGSVDRAEAEPYLALVAFTRPEQLLYLSRPRADSEGRARAASPFLAARLDENEPDDPASASSPVSSAALDKVGTPAELAELSAGQHGTPALAAALAAVLSVLPVSPQKTSALSSAAAAAWARGFTNRPQPLGPALLGKLLQRDADGRLMIIPVCRLESLGACAFQHFARYHLRLAEPREDGLRVAGLYRELLTGMLRGLARDPTTRHDTGAQRLRDAGHEALGELGSALQRERGDGLQHLLNRAAWLVEQLADHLAQQFATGRSPYLYEVPLGGSGGSPLGTVEAPLGELTLRLSGRIDRVDATTDGQAVAVDYSLSKASVDWGRLLAGESLASAVELLALEGLYAAGGPYGAAQLTAADAERLSIEPKWSDRAARKGQIEFAVTSLTGQAGSVATQGMLRETRRIVGELADRLGAGEVGAVPLKRGKWTACGSCPYRPVCRFDPASGDSYRYAPDGRSAELRAAVTEGTEFPGSANAPDSRGARE